VPHYTCIIHSTVHHRKHAQCDPQKCHTFSFRYLCQIWTNFQNSFTGTLCKHFAI